MTTAPSRGAEQAPGRIVAAWAKNDGDAFAAACTEDASLILPGVYLKSRAEIRDFMTAAYAGPFKGTRVHGDPLSMRYLSDDVAVIVTQGGVLHPGDEKVTPEREIRATWVLTRKDDGWLIAAYQNTPTAA
ncbi:hypothetical protein Acor_00390 [Acrocarpospora corrugata]|uniref:DUF4440 domain-containing protein n=1 Tax=Acrocarpospora corrugata TaxID=35763 RepID=A0A5M3VUE0_9ACTN|nr:SgcJ/EcaC family oxidoreductase [Acrocarpospora corrugata]GER97977.1 hypothetical protein Acor_00390 [Acrocarpospora corrugata]